MKEEIIIILLALVILLLFCALYLLYKLVKNNNSRKIYEIMDTAVNRALADNLGRNNDALINNFVAITNTANNNLSNMLNQHGEHIKTSVNQLIIYEKDSTAAMEKRISDLSYNIDRKVQDIKTTLDASIKDMREEIKGNLREVREDNSRQMEKMRVVVDEKLSHTLNNRLASTFNTVSAQLDNVHKELGKIQALSSGVSDLKRVLSNVKTRGVWGEVSLNSLLEQILISGQYEKSVKIGNTQERVDYAIILPGKNNDSILLPIDCKYPTEDYQRLMEASEAGNKELEESATKQLIKTIKEQAKSISTKYIKPPHTTDFAIMYLPTEGLFGEVIRVAGLSEELQNQHRIVLAGPTTIAALLNSLQMGFTSLAIEKSSAEIYRYLIAFKKDFDEFKKLIEKAKNKINEAANTLDDATKRSGIIDKKLAKVEDNKAFLALNEPEDDD